MSAGIFTSTIHTQLLNVFIRFKSMIIKIYLIQYRFMYKNHRVDKVLLFLQSSEFGTPPPPHTQASVDGTPPPLWFRGGIPACGRGGGGGPIRTRGQTLWYSRYIGTVCTFWQEQTSIEFLKNFVRTNQLGLNVMSQVLFYTVKLNSEHRLTIMI